MISSLARLAPSGLTPDEEARRQEALERELWLKHGAVVVRLRTPESIAGLPRFVTMALEAWVRARFGERRVA